MAYRKIVTDLAPYYGAIAYFAPEGRTIETVTVSDTEKPAGETLTDWEELGCIETASLSREVEGGETRRCWNSTLRKWVKRPTKHRLVSLVYEMSIQEVSQYLHQVALNVADSAIDEDDGSAVPNSQPEGAYTGWLKVQVEDTSGVVTLAEAWVELTMPNAMQIAGASASVPQLRMEVLDNTGNKVAFGQVDEEEEEEEPEA